VTGRENSGTKRSFKIKIQKGGRMFTKSMVIAGTCIIGIVFAPGCSKKITKVAEQTPVASKMVAPVKARDGSGVLDRSNINDVLAPIYFDFDRYTLRPGEIAKLERIASLLSSARSIRLVCEGYCDDRGSDEYNMGLGENRARTIKQWLSGYGIPDQNIETTSYGKERPAVQNCADDYCHAQNRRAEWRVIAQ
jgi:peptidoglycan-associated lipoprotein